MLENSVFINYLVDKMSRRYLDREGDRGLVVGADHAHGGGALDHLHLLPQLQADGLSLVNMKMHGVLSPVI